MTTVHELFVHAGVRYDGAVSWGDEVPLTGPGVYVISTSDNQTDDAGSMDCPINLQAVTLLLAEQPEATVDGKRADAQQFADRLRAMWPAGQPVVYIGLAGTSTRQRVEQFYKTRIGARAPHAGGWPIKMLDADRLWVHYGPTDTPATAEAVMVNRFVVGLPSDARRSLIDPATPLPFANLALPARPRKNHGFRGVTAPKSGLSDRTESRVRERESPPAPSILGEPGQPGGVAQSRPTQNVTVKDLAAGQIRIPGVSKSLFPESKSEIRVELGGEAHTASWNPRTSGDKERSGVIRVGRSRPAEWWSFSTPCGSVVLV